MAVVGGEVIGVTRKPDKTHVHVAECPHYPKHAGECPRPDTCSVYVEEKRRDNGDPVAIEVGDKLWWQSGWCMWTPAEERRSPPPLGHSGCGKTWDIQLPKIGFSH